jgi:hypothetical protein
MTAVQTINTPAHQAKTRWHGNRAGYFGITDREYFALGRFSTAADKAGLKTVSIGRGAFGVGCCMKMSGKAADYEVMVDGHGSMLLGKVEASGKRIRLAEGGSNIEASWAMLLTALKTSEGRLP